MSDSSTAYVKRRPHAPAGFFAAEAAGLAWLAEATAGGGADVVAVQRVTDDALALERLTSAPPTPEAARRFGRSLARTHEAGASAFGALPPSSQHYFFGPLDQPLELPHETFDDFGTFYAEARLRPVAAEMDLDADDAALLAAVCDALRGGAAEFGRSPVRPARVHGDLWSGNVMWTSTGVVLIDPAACGHHPLADIAMLLMFGAPHVEDIIAGYEQARPLRSGWRDEIPLHQLFGYLVHLRLFGSSYLAPTRRCLQDAARLLGVG